MISRRKLLYAGAAVVGVALGSPLWVGSVLAQEVSAAANSDVEQFYQLSLFLTERQALDRNVSLRVLAMCTQEDSLFPEKMKALWGKIQQQPLANVGLLQQSPFYQDEVLKATVQKIVSAWYLGYIGTPVSQRAVDDTRLITYTGALMYEPTRDATVIPSYSRGHTNYWVDPPATLAND